jgi:hypothetical protein
MLFPTKTKREIVKIYKTRTEQAEQPVAKMKA